MSRQYFRKAGLVGREERANEAAREAGQEPVTAPVTAVPQDPMALLAAILDRMTQQQPVGLSGDELKSILQEVGEANAEGMRRQLQKDNPNPPNISAFSYPEGDRDHPKEPLSRPTFFCGMREKEDRLTPYEILAYNAITASATANRGKWTAEVRKVGEGEELYVTIPTKGFNAMTEQAPLLVILPALASGDRLVDETYVYQRMKELEAKLDALTAA